MRGRCATLATTITAAYVCLLLNCGQAGAQRLLVLTRVLTATRESVGVYCHSVDMKRGESLPGPEFLPGVTVLGATVLAPDGRHAWTISGNAPLFGDATPRNALSFVSVFRTAPFQSLTHARFSMPAGWQAGASVAVETGSEWMLVSALSRIDEYGISRGRLDVRRYAVKDDALCVEDPATVPLPGAPVGLLPLSGGGRAAVLCQDAARRGACVQIWDFSDLAPELVAERDMSHGAPQAYGGEPGGLAASLDGQRLFILTHGYRVDQPGASPVSWLHVFDNPSLDLVCESLMLPGVPQRDVPAVHAAIENVCWVVTREPGSADAHALCVQLAETGAELVSDIPLLGVTEPVVMAISPNGTNIAVSADRRLEIWPGGVPKDVRSEYRSHISALVWMPEGLFLGEGSRVHLIDPRTAAPLASVPLQTGQVTGLVVVPQDKLPWPDSDGDGLTHEQERQLGTDACSNDTDQDGIADGVDPDPTCPSPRLTYPPAIVFQGRGDEGERRRIWLSPGLTTGCEHASWRLDATRQMPVWLRVEPLHGRLPGWVDVRVETGLLSSDDVNTASIEIHAQDTRSGVAAAGSPGLIFVHVLPERSDVRQVLWLLGAADRDRGVRQADGPRDFSQLAELLAAPPLYFSQAESDGLFLDTLRPSSIVVLDAEAASRGVITRAALLDFVAEGGGLLFLGGYVADEAARELTDWLAPFGVQLDTRMKVSGRVSVSGGSSLTRWWRDFAIQDGCSLIPMTEAPLHAFDAVLPESAGATHAAFVARQFGRGRVAMLAAPTPLQNAAVQTAANRRFAADLFRWLCDTGGIHDFDGDGLTDSLEDRNGNGVVDAGETRFDTGDTDGDGIPDGKEDRNRNGWVDEGETSPLNPDSDGDGVWDGADDAPAPPTNAPHVGYVEPPSCPAEGGTAVVVTGRNFTSQTLLWFGTEKALNVRCLDQSTLLAETPPAARLEGGGVDVRVENPGVSPAGILRNGFHYTEQSAVDLSVVLLDSGAQIDSGDLRIWLSCAPTVAVGRLSFRVELSPRDDIQIEEVVPGAMAEFTGRRVMSRPSPSGGMWIDVSAGRRGSPAGELAVIRWKTSKPLHQMPPARASIQNAVVLAPNGAALRATTQDAAIQWVHGM